MTGNHVRSMKEKAVLLFSIVAIITIFGLLVSAVFANFSSEHLLGKFMVFVYAGLLGLSLNIWFSLNDHEWASSANQRFVALIIPSAVLTITWVISSNLALSLGMIGALSIVRFRNPVKSPFELTTFFVYIVIGVAAGVELNYAIMMWLFAMLSPFLVWISNWLTGLGNTQESNTNPRFIANFKVKGQTETLLAALSDYSNEIISVGRNFGTDDTVQIVLVVEGVEAFTAVKSTIEQCAQIIFEDLQSSS